MAKCYLFRNTDVIGILKNKNYFKNSSQIFILNKISITQTTWARLLKQPNSMKTFNEYTRLFQRYCVLAT